MKKRIVLFSFIVICILCTSFSLNKAYDLEEGEFEEPSTDTQAEIIEEIEDTLTEGGNTEVDTGGETVEVTMPDGSVIYVRGHVVVSNGKISADYIGYGNADISNAQNFETTETGFTVDYTDSLAQDGTLITGGSGIKFEDGVLTAEHADSFITQGSFGTNSDNFESKADIFYVGKADSVLSDCVTVSNIEDSAFKIYSNAVEIEVGGEFIEITDCSYNNFVFESNNGKVMVSKRIPSTYKIENGILISRSDGITEKIETNNTAIIEIDPSFGFSCIKITPPGVYWYHENLLKDFGVYIPSESDEYILCLRKNTIQVFDNYDGLVDFADKNIRLNKIVNYLRYPFDNGKLLSLFMDNVYQGKDNGNKATMNLDSDFIFIDNFFVENENSSTGMLSYINNGRYAVYEYNNGKEVKRYGRFNNEFKANIIKRYNSFFGKKNPLITFENGIVTQEGFNSFGTLTTVKLICKDCLQKILFEKEMERVSSNNKIERLCPT